MPERIADHFGQSLTSLVEEAQALRGDIHTAEKARRINAQINLGLLGLLVVLVGLLAMVTYQNNQLAHQVSQTNARMADCTTPGGRCYDQGRARTGEAIAAVLHAEVAAVECARLWPGQSGPELDRKLEACVAERLARFAAQQAPQPTPQPTVTPSR